MTKEVLAYFWQQIIARIHGRMLPEITTEDNGKFLRVVEGTWATSSIFNAEEASF